MTEEARVRASAGAGGRGDGRPAAGRTSADAKHAEAPAEILARMAPAAGLDACLEPFPRVATDTLRDALADARFLMAPMAGVSDAAWRVMARAGGARLAYTEMVSVAGIHYGGDKTWELVVPQAPEPDIAVQLFGSKPEQFREAAELVAARLGERLVLIDVNMACPVPKVTRKGEGSALLDDPARAEEIVSACRAGLDAAGSAVPVTCKIRRGRRTGEPDQAPGFAHRLEDAGCAAVAVHGRYADQFYRGEADWSAISRVADAVDIPVIASGDMLDARRAAQALDETGATAVMIARGSYGDPWIFADAERVRAGGEPLEHPLMQRLEALECHLRLLAATGAHMARGRSICAWYFKGLPGAASWRNSAMQCVTLDDFLELIASLKDRIGDEA